MLRKLTGVFDGKDVWINPTFIVYVSPANTNDTAICMSNGQSFIFKDLSMEEIISMLDESEDWKRGSWED